MLGLDFSSPSETDAHKSEGFPKAGEPDALQNDERPLCDGRSVGSFATAH